MKISKSSRIFVLSNNKKLQTMYIRFFNSNSFKELIFTNPQEIDPNINLTIYDELWVGNNLGTEKSLLTKKFFKQIFSQAKMIEKIEARNIDIDALIDACPKLNYLQTLIVNGNTSKDVITVDNQLMKLFGKKLKNFAVTLKITAKRGDEFIPVRINKNILDSKVKYFRLQGYDPTQTMSDDPDFIGQNKNLLGRTSLGVEWEYSSDENNWFFMA